MKTATIAAAVASVIALQPGAVDAKRAKKPKKSKGQAACDMDYLPFETGRSWTYEYVIPPGVEEQENAIKADVPEEYRIEVMSVEKKGSAEVITLKESYRQVATETVLTCSSSGLEVPLNSFFFAGELAGALGMSTSDIKIKDGPMFPTSLKGAQPMYAAVSAHVTRDSSEGDAVHLPATLEIERQITVGRRSDSVDVTHGLHDALPVQIEISGRVVLNQDAERKVPLPQGNAMLWAAENLGVVRAYNRLGQGWELKAATDASGNAIESEY